MSDLKRSHTKQLLKKLDYYRAAGDAQITAIIRKILATREHIPNKEEAKKIRQEKAKAKKHR